MWSHWVTQEKDVDECLTYHSEFIGNESVQNVRTKLKPVLTHLMKKVKTEKCHGMC